MICHSCMQPEGLAARVDELRRWARSRIEWCRAEERKFAAGILHRRVASMKKRTLQAVLRMLEREGAAR